MKATLLESWLKKEKRVALLSKRKYLHFDRFIDFEKNQHSLYKLVSDKNFVEKHAFYPFIKTCVQTPRYKQKIDSNNKKIRILETKVRPISYASHFDALIYSWYSTILTDVYEKQLDNFNIRNCVLAYLETGKSNIDYSFEVFSNVINYNQCVAICIDISSFFDNLDHDILKKMWSKTIGESTLPKDHFNVYKSLTNYSVVSKDALDEIFAFRLPNNRYCEPKEFRTFIRQGKLIEKNPNKNSIISSNRFNKQCGIPQGSPISATLSNIYMIDFDMELNSFSKTQNAIYKRYCDDIIIICETVDVDVFITKINSLALVNELTINPEKTEITYFNTVNGKMRGYTDINLEKFKNLQYLGFEFNGENIYIRASSISRYKRRIANEIRESLKAANGNNSISSTVFKRKLLKRFSSKGKRNFVTYAIRSANEIMNSKTIRKQYNNTISSVLKSFKEKQHKYNSKLTKKNITPKAVK